MTGAGDVDVVQAAGWDRDRGAGAGVEDVVGVVFEHEVEVAGVDEQAGPDAVGDAVGSPEARWVVVVVERLGGTDVFDPGR